MAAPQKFGFDIARLGRLQDWMQRYVDDGKIPFADTLIFRHGELAWRGTTGLCDVANAKVYGPGNIVRIYSMTKPITSVALMMLHEQGLFHIDDPVEEFLPDFTDLQVLRADAKSLDEVVDLKVKPTVHHLLTHMSGLTYGFQGGLLGEAYEAARADFYADAESPGSCRSPHLPVPAQLSAGRKMGLFGCH